MPAPLPPAAAKLAADFLRALAARQRRLRCFLQWPPDVDAVAPAYALLAQVPELNVILGDGLIVNGAPLRGVSEFESILRARGIGSLTIRAGVQPRELDAFVGPHIELRAHTRLPAPPPTAEEPLEVDELDRLYTALRHWKTAADRLRAHPPGEPGTAAALGLAASSIASLLSIVPRVTFAPAGGTLIANSEPLAPRHAAAAIALLELTLSKRGIRGLTLWRGLEPDECHSLSSFLAVDDPAHAEQLRLALDGDHVAFNIPHGGPAESDHGLPSFPQEMPETEILPLEPLERDGIEETDTLDLRAKFLL